MLSKQLPIYPAFHSSLTKQRLYSSCLRSALSCHESINSMLYLNRNGFHCINSRAAIVRANDQTNERNSKRLGFQLPSSLSQAQKTVRKTEDSQSTQPEPRAQRERETGRERNCLVSIRVSIGSLVLASPGYCAEDIGIDIAIAIAIAIALTGL